MYPLVEQCVYLISAAIYGGPTLWVLYCTTAAVTWIYRWTQGGHCTSESCIVHCTMFYSWSTSKGGIVPCTIVPRVAGGAVLSSSGFVIPDLSRIYCHGPLASSDSIFLSTQTNLREFWIIFFCKVGLVAIACLLACGLFSLLFIMVIKHSLLSFFVWMLLFLSWVPTNKSLAFLTKPSQELLMLSRSLSGCKSQSKS